MRIAIFTILFLSIGYFSYNAQESQTIAFSATKECEKYTNGGQGGIIVYTTHHNNQNEAPLHNLLIKPDGKQTILYSVYKLMSITEVENYIFNLTFTYDVGNIINSRMQLGK